MSKNLLKLSFAALLMTTTLMTTTITTPVLANPIEPGFNADKDFGTTIWYAPSDHAAKQADIDFVVGMRPHHAGALTMSADYLGDKDSANASLKGLARAIADNQEFEIKMLDIIENFRKTPNEKLPSFMGMHPAAIKDLAQKLRFSRTPIPGIISSDHVSVRDVQFAKAMIIHHQGAVDMALDYLNNPHAKNGYLRHMCLDILVDQKREINFMQAVINRYAGNPDDVEIDESMIHGMEGMSHGHGGHHHKGVSITARQDKKPEVAKHIHKQTPKSQEQLKPINRNAVLHDHGDHH